MINDKNLEKLKLDFLQSKPFNHVVIDDFIESNIAENVANEIPEWNDEKAWGVFYNNSIEVKKTQNHWNSFKENTYKLFSFLISETFLEILRFITNCNELTIDQGLHGGCYHCHGNLGKLIVHLDYIIHTKLHL